MAATAIGAARGSLVLELADPVGDCQHPRRNRRRAANRGSALDHLRVPPVPDRYRRPDRVDGGTDPRARRQPVAALARSCSVGRRDRRRPDARACGGIHGRDPDRHDPHVRSGTAQRSRESARSARDRRCRRGRDVRRRCDRRRWHSRRTSSARSFSSDSSGISVAQRWA